MEHILTLNQFDNGGGDGDGDGDDDGDGDNDYFIETDDISLAFSEFGATRDHNLEPQSCTEENSRELPVQPNDPQRINHFEGSTSQVQEPLSRLDQYQHFEKHHNVHAGKVHNDGFVEREGGVASTFLSNIHNACDCQTTAQKNHDDQLVCDARVTQRQPRDSTTDDFDGGEISKRSVTAPKSPTTDNVVISNGNNNNNIHNEISEAKASAEFFEVIELLEDDCEENEQTQQDDSNEISSVLSVKRQKLSLTASAPSYAEPLHVKSSNETATAVTHHRRHISSRVIPGSSFSAIANTSVSQNNLPYTWGINVPSSSLDALFEAKKFKYASFSNERSNANVRPRNSDEPLYLNLPSGFSPSWNSLVPSHCEKSPPETAAPAAIREKYFKLSLLNVNEFTITGLPVQFSTVPTSVSGLRVPIKQVSRGHGKAVFERDKEDAGGEGKWRIPLGAYHAFVAYLTSDPYCRIEGVPQHQLQIASLEKARQEKGYPSPQKLIDLGVPAGLANALAPFQRGGVDFVVEKNGRALIADDMGLGKTIQGIASMSVYFDEWPVLVLCPSSARYHWESEFQSWLGIDSHLNKPDFKNNDNGFHHTLQTRNGKCALLSNKQIHVIPSCKEKIFPYPDTKVIICSYGLVAPLIDAGKIFPKQFRCAIVDESHMLKNKGAKRTAKLIPILNAADRCVLLSGTPALARPGELWPQLEILRTDEHQYWWENEVDFNEKYVKRGGSCERAELHTMLTGTVMIRRLKNDILTTMPRKLRHKAIVHVLNSKNRLEFKGLLIKLRQSNGLLGNIAKKQHAEARRAGGDFYDIDDENPQELGAMETGAADTLMHNSSSQQMMFEKKIAAVRALELDMQQKYEEGRSRIHSSLATNGLHLSVQQRSNTALKLERELCADLDRVHTECIADIERQFRLQPEAVDENEKKRKQVLSRLYGLTGDVKVPVLVNMLNRWLRDPTKGKLCIFAHHLSVLDEIQNQAELSNSVGSNRKFIRIDGSTLPKHRQDQIKSFQTDPSQKIALLGITAAGVAVTLTASSTVWFAELFWTPAIMIQAEDRCHRIGQQAQVNCLYFVAKGTLDDILWKLIEKKFRDLGEFVEGKEKLKLVIDKVFENEKELYTIFDELPDSDEDNDNDSNDDTDISNVLRLDDELEQELEQLGEEERTMMRLSDGDNDEPDAVGSVDNHTIDFLSFKTRQGKSEEEAISLLDDNDADDDDNDDNNVKQKISNHIPIPSTPVSPSLTFNNWRLYKILFDGPVLGCEVCSYQGRIIVSSIIPDRLQRLGPSSKPSVGHVLAAINGQALPLFYSLNMIVQSVQIGLKRPPLELTFAEDSSFTSNYCALINFQRKTQEKSTKNVGSHAVIEVIDDD